MTDGVREVTGMNTEQHIVEWTDKEPGPARGVGAMSDTSHTDGGVWCGWCHTVRAPHTHAVDGYRELPMPSAEAKREVMGQWPEQPKNSPQYPVEFSFAASVPTEFYNRFAQELASAEETLAHRVRKLRSEEAAEVMAVNAYQREAGQAALRAHRAKMRLGAIRDELRSLGSE